MPGALLSSTSPRHHPQSEKMASTRSDLYLIVSFPRLFESRALLSKCPADLRSQSSEDTVYEQDILRDPGSVKPWLSYIEYKMQHGTAYEQAFVGLSSPSTLRSLADILT